MKVVLVINSGSSSIKYQLIDIEKQEALCSGLVERIGLDMGNISHKTFVNGEKKHTEELPIPNHTVGLNRVAELLSDKEHGVIDNPNDIKVVGHRLVHGGDTFSDTVLVTEEVKSKIKELYALAPLHNPSTLQGVEVAEKIFSNARQVGVFDTAFHQTMPKEAYRYAIPTELYEDKKLRKYGFHGTSHKFVSQETMKFLNNNNAKVITIHLGNGSSMAAIDSGVCKDTTMGLTPLDGLIMGTRSGCIDPGLIFYMQDNLGYSSEQVNNILLKESGIKGLTGHTDMRDVEDAIEKGDANCDFAYDLYAYRVKGYIGSYISAMNGVDAIVFTAGIGENSSEVRKRVCDKMDFLGIKIDLEKNEERGGIRDISAKDSKVKVLVVPTNEELEIANQANELVG